MSRIQTVIGLVLAIGSYITAIQLYLGMAFSKTTHLSSLGGFSEFAYVLTAGASSAMVVYFPVGFTFIIGLLLAFALRGFTAPKIGA